MLICSVSIAQFAQLVFCDVKLFFRLSKTQKEMNVKPASKNEVQQWCKAILFTCTFIVWVGNNFLLH